MTGRASNAGAGDSNRPPHSPEALDATVASALDHVRRQWPGAPKLALILGTGLGGLAEEIQAEATIPYRDIPGFPHSTALSHKSRLVCGQLDGVTVVTMQGRCHLYEGYGVDQLAFPVHVMHGLGARTLVVSNASGGLNPHYSAGDIMVMNDHVNLMWTSPRSDAAGGASVRRPRSAVYDPSLIQRALRVARREDFVAHQGAYVAVTGPTYETRAEYRMFRRIGGDVVGMSTVPEVVAAVQCRMRVLGLSLVTNVAKPDAAEVVDAQHVVDVAEVAAPHLRKIVADVLRN